MLDLQVSWFHPQIAVGIILILMVANALVYISKANSPTQDSSKSKELDDDHMS